MMRRLVALVIAGGMLLVLAGPPVDARPDEVTYGDVRAQFRAGEVAGGVIFFRAAPPAFNVAAPANTLEHSIRPLPLWEGRSYCETDWHLLALAILTGAFEGEPKISRQEGVAALEPVSVDLSLDGTLLTNTERTPIKRLVQSLTVGDDGAFAVIFDGWWHQTGAFFGPGDLAVGPHTLSATVTDPDGVDVGDPITFFIDAAGTGSCI
jgi:hypothetical protein